MISMTLLNQGCVRFIIVRPTSTATKMRTMFTAVTSVGRSFLTSGFIPINAQFVMTAMMLISSKATYQIKHLTGIVKQPTK